MFFPLKELCVHLFDVASVLKKPELRWMERLLTWVESEGFRGGFVLDDYFSYLSDLRLANYNAEVCFIVKFLKETGVFISEFKIRYWKELKKPRAISKSPGIPTSFQLLNTLSKISLLEQLHILIMICSGRRFIDVSRIEITGMKVLNNKFICKIEKTKNSSQPVIFSFEFKDDDLKIDWQYYESKFLEICQTHIKTGFSGTQVNSSPPTLF